MALCGRKRVAKTWGCLGWRRKPSCSKINISVNVCILSNFSWLSLTQSRPTFSGKQRKVKRAKVSWPVYSSIPLNQKAYRVILSKWSVLSINCQVSKALNSWPNDLSQFTRHKQNWTRKPVWDWTVYKVVSRNKYMNPLKSHLKLSWVQNSKLACYFPKTSLRR